MERQKDNLTDAVEALRRNEDNNIDPQENERQVVDNEGEIITLGQDSRKPMLPFQ